MQGPQTRSSKNLKNNHLKHIKEQLVCIKVKRFSSSETSPGIDLMTHDSCFTILVEVFTNHILAKDTNFMNCIE